MSIEIRDGAIWGGPNLIWQWFCYGLSALKETNLASIRACTIWMLKVTRWKNNRESDVTTSQALLSSRWFDHP